MVSLLLALPRYSTRTIRVVGRDWRPPAWPMRLPVAGRYLPAPRVYPESLRGDKKFLLGAAALRPFLHPRSRRFDPAFINQPALFPLPFVRAEDTQLSAGQSRD